MPSLVGPTPRRFRRGRRCAEQSEKHEDELKIVKGAQALPVTTDAVQPILMDDAQTVQRSFAQAPPRTDRNSRLFPPALRCDVMSL